MGPWDSIAEMQEPPRSAGQALGSLGSLARPPCCEGLAHRLPGHLPGLWTPHWTHPEEAARAGPFVRATSYFIILHGAVICSILSTAARHLWLKIPRHIYRSF